MAFHRIFRGFCSKVGTLKAERLVQRNLILVKGAESSQFLQGLITNDMNHLTRGNPSIYAMFLNKGGRILYDTIIYKSGDDSFYVDCDSDCADQLVKHLRIFRVRRKIEIEKKKDQQAWAVFNGGFVKAANSEVLAFTDPRLKNLGIRLITGADKSLKDVAEIFGQVVEDGSYREHRYRLGIGEGPVDYPREKSFPLEGNADFLNGVSFHKGCYVGQELTARTHHTGVVRKRLMPLKFLQPLEVDPTDLQIKNEKDQNLGKLRGYCNGVGLALLRIEPALAATKCTIAGGSPEVQPYKPTWWPTSTSKTHVR